MAVTAHEIDTPRFGAVSVGTDAVWEFPGGLIGLPDCRRFARLPFAEPELPFEWLQSMDEPNIAFLVTDPHLFFPDYVVSLPAEVLEDIGLSDTSESEVRCIVTVPAQVGNMTANLLGPLVLNTKRRLGKQVAVADPRYATKHRLFPEATAHAGSDTSA